MLFLLHGWCDVSASWQFMIDAMSRNWRVVAPDWRGFGLSQWNNDVYWFPDYVADLDALLLHYSPQEPVRLVGHSLGGNAACIYAGIRPERIARLVNLEGLGLRRYQPEEAPERYVNWLTSFVTRPASAPMRIVPRLPPGYKKRIHGCRTRKPPTWPSTWARTMAPAAFTWPPIPIIAG